MSPSRFFISVASLYLLLCNIKTCEIDPKGVSIKIARSNLGSTCVNNIVTYDEGTNLRIGSCDTEMVYAIDETGKLLRLDSLRDETCETFQKWKFINRYMINNI